MKLNSIEFRVVIVFLLTFLFSQKSIAENFKVMLHDGSFPPYFFQDSDSRTGTIRDIFEAISEETGDTFEYIRVPFNRALYKFEAGEIDIEPMTNPAYRSKSSTPGVYTIPFTKAAEIVLFHSEHYVEVASPEDLLGKTIGTVKGYYYPEFSPYFEDGRIEDYPYEDENKLIRLLALERIHQALINKDFAQYVMKEQNLSDKLKLGEPYHDLDMMIRFHPSKADAVPRFNEAINKLLEAGIIEDIYDNYR